MPYTKLPLEGSLLRTRSRRPAASSPARKALVGAAALGAMALAAPFAEAAPAAPAVIEAADKVASTSAFEPFIASAENASSGTTRVIVGLQTRFDPAETTTNARLSNLTARLAVARAGLNQALAGTEHRVVRAYSALPYLALDVSPEALEALRASGEVASIHEDHVLASQLADSTQVIESAPLVTRGINGTGRVVAVLDTGVESTHPFLAGRIVDPACFAGTARPCPNGTTTQVGPGSAEPASGVDGYHGTAVAGVAVGKRSGTGTFDGVAPGANVMPIRISAYASSLESDLLAGLNYTIERKNAGVPVAAANISMGMVRPISADPADCDAAPVKSAVDSLKAAGVATVIASGNNSWTNAVTYPACVSTAVAVGATTKTDVVSTFSNSSEQVDLLAPGENLTLPNLGGQFWSGKSGTSFAAPHVAGAWASYLQRYPGTSVDDVLAAFKRSGKAVTDARNGVTKSRINVAASLEGWAYVSANQPSTSSYTPPGQANSTGGYNTVTRTAVGTYTVAFPKLGTATRGNAHVRANGSSNVRCKHTSIGGAAGNTVTLGVRCYTAAGALTDSQFIAQYRLSEAKTTKQIGYLTSTASTASNTPMPALQYNSTGATNTVSRIATGRYVANFPGFSGTGAVPQVSAMGTNANTCQITAILQDGVGVACFSGSGAASDTPFSVSFDRENTFTGRRGAQFFADNTTSLTPYTPSSSWNSTGGANKANRSPLDGSTYYGANFPGLSGSPSTVMVTAQASTTPTYCKPWTFGGTVTNVICFNSAGAQVEAKFTIAATTTG